MAKTITMSNIDSILTSNEIVVMDFWAEWCGPCRMLSPILDKISETNNDIVVGKIDVDSNSDLAAKYGVRSIPMLVFVKNGQVMTNSIGVRSHMQIQEIINSLRP